MQALATVQDRRPDARHPAAPVPFAVHAQAGKEIVLGRDEILFFEGDDADHFFEIVRGTLRCCRLIHDGRRQIYRFAGAGQMLGVSCERRYGYSAEAVTDVVVRRHRLAWLDAAMAADETLRRRVLQTLRGELAATRAQMLLLGRMSAAEKLVAFLLALAGDATGPGACIELPMTRGDIADYLGLTIETVSRKLNELHRRGMIRLETPSRVRIANVDRAEVITGAA